ncbi:MAG TPA: SagB family peptide dehydrogenase [Ktedonobacteraceae bacterium]|nr:SagB family peptide dehydrogenase [Ktedonobacteraceae bacterium]
MPNREISLCKKYAESIFRRNIEPLEPRDFHPNWADQPSRLKIYQQVERLALPAPALPGLASMGEVMARLRTPREHPRGLDQAEIATMLQFAHGLLNRRLDVNWNQNHLDQALYIHSTFGRGSASGGGMYPTEIFWVSGQSGSFLPGIYHYENGHHALARLLSGDVTRQVRRAVADHPSAMSTDQFLLISLNFWKNSFKYNSFSYHVVTQDLGALLASLRLLANGFGSDLQTLLWYADESLNDLLGLETLYESVCAVIPIPTNDLQHLSSSQARSLAPETLPQTAFTQKSAFQRSQTILHFEAIEKAHQSTLIDDEARPESRAAYRAACDEFARGEEKIILPAPSVDLLGMDILTAFRHRRSSFGRFSNAQPLSLERFATMLHFASVSCNYGSDLKGADGSPHFTRLLAFVRNIQGVTPGAYAYDGQRHCLWSVAQQDFSAFLQEHYFLQNYNMSEIAALLVIVGKPEQMLELYGNRGYRVIQAEVGLVAQSVYMAATALSFNCGAALGFDNVALNQALNLQEQERSFLFLLIGNGPMVESADFRYPLV